MPTNVNEFSLFRVIGGLKRALESIRQADGFNTTPTVTVGAVLMDKVPAGNFPQIAFEMGNLLPVQEQFGGPCQGTIRFAWPALVWGYVQTSAGKEALYQAGSALLADVFSAVYDDETMPDGGGTGTVMFANPGEVVFDMESYSHDGKGYFVAQFELVADITRGSDP